jgi:hypothetical protein
MRPVTFDNDTGQVLGTLPDGSVRITSSLIELAGKYVDSEGIVYDVEGTVNEPATAAYAREVAAGRIAAPYTVAPSIDQQRADSVQQNAQADYTRTMIDSTVDNIFTTSAALPGQIADAATKGAQGVFSIGKWVVLGLVAYAVIKAADRVPSRGHVKRYARRKVGELRKRAAKYVSG